MERSLVVSGRNLTPEDVGLGSIQGDIRRLDEDKLRILAIVQPPGLFNGFKRRVAFMVGPHLPDFLRDKIGEEIINTPMGYLEASLRQNLHSLHDNVEPMVMVGRQQIDRHRQLQGLLDRYSQGPTDPETVDLICNILRREAEEDLGIDRDSETGAFLSAMLEPKNNEERQALVQQRVIEIENLLQASEPAIEAWKDMFGAVAKAYDDGLVTFKYVRELRGILDILFKGSGDLTRASQLKIDTVNVIVGNINQAIRAAELATRAAEITRGIGFQNHPLLESATGRDSIMPSQQ